MALKAIQNQQQRKKEVMTIVANRSLLASELQKISFVKKIYPSDANFLLVQVDDAHLRYKQLIKKGIVVRNRSNQLLCKNCLRITVGTANEHKTLIKAINDLEPSSQGFSKETILNLCGSIENLIFKYHQNIKSRSMKKVPFIDRDGTLVIEPPQDYQLDSFEKLEFYPNVFQYLGKIAKELDYELVMVTNQDGLGTASFPEDTFWPVHHFLIKTFEQEGIVFKEQIIDRTFAKDNAPTRKPRTGLLTQYFSEDYDLSHSFVIGDRYTDMELAKNLGSKGILIENNSSVGVEEVSVQPEESQNDIALVTSHWEEVYHFLKVQDRTGSMVRNTNETQIQIDLNLDGTGKSVIDTGIAFLIHVRSNCTSRSAGFEDSSEW